MRGELWIPNRGMELHDEYSVPEPAAMRELWLGYVGSGQIIDAPAVDGAVRVPEEPPVAYASIDLCEVLRETFRFMRQLEEPSRSWRSFAKTNHYTDEDPFIDDTKDTTSIVQVMMAAGFIQPSDGIEEMADIMRDWRRRGIYTFANTSTLPGCETGTVNSFFKPYLLGCFDGLYGKTVAVHIDDAVHHNRSFRAEVVERIQDSQAITILVEHAPGRPVDEGSVVAPNPLEAFRLADQHFAQYAG